MLAVNGLIDKEKEKKKREEWIHNTLVRVDRSTPVCRGSVGKAQSWYCFTMTGAALVSRCLTTVYSYPPPGSVLVP